MVSVKTHTEFKKALYRLAVILKKYYNTPREKLNTLSTRDMQVLWLEVKHFLDVFQKVA